MYPPSESVSISSSVSWSPVSVTVTPPMPSPSTETMPLTLASRMIWASKWNMAVSSVSTVRRWEVVGNLNSSSKPDISTP